MDDLWEYPELAVELAKIEIELIFQEFEEALFGLLERTGKDGTQ